MIKSWLRFVGLHSLELIKDLLLSLVLTWNLGKRRFFSSHTLIREQVCQPISESSFVIFSHVPRLRSNLWFKWKHISTLAIRRTVVSWPLWFKLLFRYEVIFIIMHKHVKSHDLSASLSIWNDIVAIIIDKAKLASYIRETLRRDEIWILILVLAWEYWFSC